MNNNLGKVLLAAASLFSAAFMSVSCLKEDADEAEVLDSFSGRYNAVVTVKTSTEGKTFLQVDDEHAFDPGDWDNPFKGEVRALINYTEVGAGEDGYYKKVKVNIADEVPTSTLRMTADPVFEFKKCNIPVIIYNDWLTSCEDGYVTLHLAVRSNGDVGDFEMLIDAAQGGDLYLTYDGKNDVEGSWKDVVVAFRIREHIPESAEPGMMFKIHAYTFFGYMTIAFKISPE